MCPIGYSVGVVKHSLTVKHDQRNRAPLRAKDGTPLVKCKHNNHILLRRLLPRVHDIKDELKCKCMTADNPY